MITETERSEEIERQNRFDRTEATDFRTLLSNSIPDVKPLDFTESRALALRIKNGILDDGTLSEDAKDARDTLVFSCKGIVFKLARAFAISDDDCNELTQEGFLHAYQAALDYDPDRQEKKAKFSTYAYRMLWFSMARTSAKARHYAAKFLLYEDLSQDDDEDSDPIDETIQDENALSRDSLDENVDANRLQEILAESFRNSNLTEKQFAVLTTRYVLGHSKIETGRLMAQVFGKPVSHNSVAVIENKALAKLKRSGATEAIKQFMNDPKS